ncbi:MAG TPA: Ig domain-containing protein [Longimicrobiales bacterium]|nr:Ig domain-containing protein [Longimicrobiales bacterium]
MLVSVSSFARPTPVIRRGLVAVVAMGVVILGMLACGSDSPVVITPSVVTTSLPDGVEGLEYGPEELTATGGDGRYAWSVATGSGDLPPGLALADDGTISGIPTAVGSWDFTVRVRSGTQSAQRALSIAVHGLLTITSSSLPDGVEGVEYGPHELEATGGDASYAWALAPGSDPLPPGLTLEAEGTISGTPTQGGSWDFAVEVRSGEQTAVQGLTISVTAPLTVTTTSLPEALRDREYGPHDLEATGGDGSYAWALAPGSDPLPPGLSLNEAGTVSGTPTAVGSWAFIVEVRSGGETAEQVLSIVVVEPTPVSLRPSDWRMPRGATVRFALAEEAGPVTWSVNGIVGGDETVGTIDGTGIYRAPSSVPTGPVTVAAASDADPGRVGMAEVTVVADAGPGRIRWTLWTPLVLSVGSTGSAVLEVAFDGYPTLDVDPVSGPTLEPQALRTGVYGFSFDAGPLLSGYAEGDLHEFVGYLNCGGCSRITRGNVFVNVRDGTVPSATPTVMADGVQAMEHVVNIRYDDLFLAGSIPPDLIQTFYEHFPDDFDFIAVVEQVSSFNNRTYRAVRNDVGGLGLSFFNRGLTYGSASRLKGLVDYPISIFFDAGETALAHEIGHRWMMFLDNAVLNAGGSHWPVSSLARGVMGFNLAGGVGGSFPFEVRPVGDGSYRLESAPRRLSFNDMELYLMGLLPADSVSTHVVFRDQGIPLTNGSTGLVDPVSVEDVIARNGVRTPAYPDAPRDFGLATIVVSKDRLLTTEELEFFNHLAARGQAREELHFTSGFSSGTTLPFYLATGGRATLTTRVIF